MSPGTLREWRTPDPVDVAVWQSDSPVAWQDAVIVEIERGGRLLARPASGGPPEVLLPTAGTTTDKGNGTIEIAGSAGNRVQLRPHADDTCPVCLAGYWIDTTVEPSLLHDEAECPRCAGTSELPPPEETTASQSLDDAVRSAMKDVVGDDQLRLDATRKFGGRKREEGFRAAAAILGERVKSEDTDLDERDQLVFPLLHNYRHAIELRLKRLLTELEVVPPAKHTLMCSWQQLRPNCSRSEPAILKRVHHGITFFDELDTNGEVSRYSVKTDQSATLPQHRYLPPDKISSEGDDLWSLLDQIEDDLNG